MENHIIPFYHETDEYGCFSNWYPASFEYAGIKYSSSEQFMMYQKVVMFKQYDLGQKILATESPKEQKHLGRTHFPEFNATVWDATSYTIVKRGILAKFQQNEEIKKILLDTGNALLVEASPLDRIWGVGVGTKKALNVSNWQGKNLLGRALMQVREDLHSIPEYISAKDIESFEMWSWEPVELMRHPQYRNAMKAYYDTLPDDHLRDVIDQGGFTLADMEYAMHTNMGGGFPVIGFWELKQEIYDIYRITKSYEHICLR